MGFLLVISILLNIIGIIFMSEQFDALKAQVNVTIAGEQAAIVAIQALSARSAEDPAAIQALADALKVSSEAVAAAIAAAGV